MVTTYQGHHWPDKATKSFTSVDITGKNLVTVDKAREGDKRPMKVGPHRVAAHDRDQARENKRRLVQGTGDTEGSPSGGLCAIRHKASDGGTGQDDTGEHGEAKAGTHRGASARCAAPRFRRRSSLHLRVFTEEAGSTPRAPRHRWMPLLRLRLGLWPSVFMRLRTLLVSNSPEGW